MRSIQVSIGHDLVFERDEDMDEDEVQMFDKKLTRSLKSLKLAANSILLVEARFTESEDPSLIEIQLIDGSEVKASLMKKGTPVQTRAPQE